MLQSDGIWYRDAHGRAVMLRGVNLSGATKMPKIPDILSHVSQDLYESERSVSFVGRPFPLNEADEHFTRLRHWGFNFLRLNITWEAIEHEGPGIYDQDYLDYLVALLKKAKEYDFKCFIDPHQDVWSRFTGGSGAPSWTLKMVGLNIKTFKESYAALIHNTFQDKENFPKMIWPTNYYKLACATMFTVFFGGRLFAPHCIVQSKSQPNVKWNIQDFLQQHYMNAILQVAKRIEKEPGLQDDVVLGYDTLNEPHGGWIGYSDVTQLSCEQELKNGATPTPFQAMLLGEGHACAVEQWAFTWRGPAYSSTQLLDPQGCKAWLPDVRIEEGDYFVERTPGCLWASEGVWDKKTHTILKPRYFSQHPKTGDKIHFLDDFFKPFVLQYTQVIRSVHSQAVVFVEPPVNEHPPTWDPKLGDPDERLCYAPHWYDGITLLNKSFNRWYNVDFLSAKRGKYLSYATAVKFGESGRHPCIIGEIGIPYDMDNRYAYKTGDYENQTRALDANLCALESNLLNFTLWNYCPVNTFKWGDGWNGEDLSIFSYDEARRVKGLLDQPKDTEPVVVQCVQQESSNTTITTDLSFHTLTKSSSLDPQNDALINLGGRALKAINRPFALHTAGTPTLLHFNMREEWMVFTFEHEPDYFTTQEPLKLKMSMKIEETLRKPPREELHRWTEFYLPRLYFPSDTQVETCVVHGSNVTQVSCTGEWIINTAEQRLWYKCPCAHLSLTPTLEGVDGSRSSIVEPCIRHTLIIRRRQPQQRPIAQLAKQVAPTGEQSCCQKCCC